MSRRLPPLAPPRRSRRLTAPASRTSRRYALLLGAALVAGAPHRAAAQGTVLVQGIADAELWTTDSSSLLLTRNEGRPAALGRLNLWGVAELGTRVVVYAAGTAEGGSARHEPGTEWYTDMAGVRYTWSDALMFDAGKMPHPVGAFASRRYSTRNPLIGVPDGYPVQYPIGLQLSGARGRVDYRAAVVSLPIYREGYVPDPSVAPRPAVGGGFTPTTGVRVGVSATWGPYLNRELAPEMLAGRPWRAYTQQVGAVDAQLSRGYLELRGELAAARYEVPGRTAGRATTVRGLTYYVEGKYTFAPRFFMAGRVERNDYAYVQPVADSVWIANPTNMYNAELGAGFRLGPRTLLKSSVRADRWIVPPALRGILGDGTAFALQLSQTFDVFDAALGRRE
jgi:hypothetical protein